MATLYIYSRCSTCQEALKFLKQNSFPVVVKEIVQETPSIDELQQMLTYMGGNLTKLFNTSGQLYREMELSKKLPTLSQDEALQLLHQHGMLIKRPFLLTGQFGLVGFKEAEWQRRLAPTTHPHTEK